MASTTEAAAEAAATPSGFYLKHNAVSRETWNEIRDWLDLDLEDPKLGLSGDSRLQQQRDASNETKKFRIPWEASTAEQNRPVAQFGFRYDYVRDVVDMDDGDSATPPIPDILQRLLLTPLASSSGGGTNEQDEIIRQETFTQCIIKLIN